MSPNFFGSGEQVKISEIFYSIQGEGRLAGMPSVFVRTAGCNLRCVWCDTPYASWQPAGREWSVEDIVTLAQSFPTRHAVLTGGEPMLAPDIEKLAVELKRAHFHITIETAATLFKPVACDLLSMSPKLSHSTPWKRQQGKFAQMHEKNRLEVLVLQKFIDAYDYQLKFVLERRGDVAELQALLNQLKHVDRSRVLLMAQARTKLQLHAKSRWIVEVCKQQGFVYSPRLHIELFGNRRGT